MPVKLFTWYNVCLFHYLASKICKHVSGGVSLEVTYSLFNALIIFFCLFYFLTFSLRSFGLLGGASLSDVLYVCVASKFAMDRS